MDLLNRLCSLMEEESDEYRQLLRDALGQGKSFARARGEALGRLTGAEEELLSAPNAALALEYMRAIKKLGSGMQPIAVLRGAPHHAREIATETSASAIRRVVRDQRVNDAAQAMPDRAFSLLQKNIGAAPDDENTDIALLSALRMMNKEQIAKLADVAEGLENILWKACRESGTREELLARVKSKRYTYARLSRIAAHAMIGTDQGLLRSCPFPHYIRLLGLRKEAFGALAHLQKNSALPIIDRGKALEGDVVFELERRATDMRALLSRDAACRAADADLTHRLVVV